MSVMYGLNPFSSAMLRIPMRGYEAQLLTTSQVARFVTNPHAGL